MKPVAAEQLTASRVRLCGSSSSSCGYCKNKSSSSVSYGILSINMTVEDYEALMLRGWRRCGTYFYKPSMHKTCCPCYTIRLHVNDVTLTKSQRKVLRTMSKYITMGDNPRETEDAAHIDSNDNAGDKNDSLSCEEKAKPAAKKRRELTLDMELASFTQEKYNLYRRYQVDVHKDKPSEVNERGFTRFLVESSLNKKNARNNIQKGTRAVAALRSCDVERIWSSSDPTAFSDVISEPFPFEFGTYHQLYRLDGELIAVGVNDILPSGLSSVYLYYNNDFRNLVLGKFTAIKEIEFCRRFQLPYYYMGFYIHSCEKMRYKAEYRPSELLCPTTLKWFPYEHCKKLLDKFNFTPFDPALADERAVIPQGHFTGIISADGDNESMSQYAADSSHHQTETGKGKADGADNRSDKSNDEEGQEVSDESDLPTALDAFAPRFSFGEKNIDPAGMVPLDIGHPMGCLFLEHFDEGNGSLRQFVQGWIEVAGEVAMKIPVSLK